MAASSPSGSFLMNLAEIDTALRESLLKREDCIGFFVYKGTFCWVASWEAFFNLDQKKNFDAGIKKYKDNPRLVSEYQKGYKEFRSGIVTLTEDLFPRYRDGETAKVLTTDMLRGEFFSEDAGQYSVLSRQVEAELSFNTPMREELIQLRMRLFSKLPKFYINYDRKIFMHMVRGRSYEAVVLDGWWGAECDFEHMIPTSHRYWVRSIDEDFWAVTNFSNG